MTNRTVLILLAVLTFAQGAAAQEDAPEEGPVPQPPAALSEAPAQGEASAVASESASLIYSVNRTAERAFDTARAVQVITADDLWRRGARTLPEVLMEEAGIFVQQTSYGGGSPIIRGLMGKHVLLLVNGVKVNTATYRFGPIQYLSTIDVSMVERIEIVRGVGSVLGSDTLGGVINIVTKKGPPQGGGSFGAAVSSRFSTADRGLTGRGEAFGQGQKYRFSAGATYRHAGDVEGGQAVGRQKATGYGEGAGNLEFEYFLSPDRTLSVGYLHLEQDEVPRTDRLASGNNLVFSFDPQRLQLLSVGYNDLTDREWTDSLRVTGFWNRQEEGRQEIRTRTPTLENLLDDRQDVLGLNLELSVFPGQSHRLIYGVEYFHEKIRSTAEDIDLVTGSVTPRRGTWTDGATYETLGVYIQDRFSVRKWLTLALGGRYGRFSSAGTENSSVGLLDLKSTQAAFTSSASAVVHVTSRLNLVGSVTRGFRAPNLDDISVLNDRGREGLEVPNPNTQPERITTYEAGFKFASTSLEGSALYHDSRLTDLLVRAPGTLAGLPFFDLNGDGSREATEPLVLQRQNIGEAKIHGLELAARWLPHPTLALFGSYTSTLGDDETAGLPLTRIPPAFGTAGARWSGKSKLQPWAEVVYLFAAAQRRLSPADIGDARIGPSGTDGFDVFHLRGGVALADLRLKVAVENVTDETYKYHGSGVFRPGRQLVVGAEYRF